MNANEHPKLVSLNVASGQRVDIEMSCHNVEESRNITSFYHQQFPHKLDIARKEEKAPKLHSNFLLLLPGRIFLQKQRYTLLSVIDGSGDSAKTTDTIQQCSEEQHKDPGTTEQSWDATGQRTPTSQDWKSAALIPGTAHRRSPFHVLRGPVLDLYSVGQVALMLRLMAVATVCWTSSPNRSSLSLEGLEAARIWQPDRDGTHVRRSEER